VPRRRSILLSIAVSLTVGAPTAALGNGGLPVAPPTTPVSTEKPATVGTLSAHDRVLQFRGALHNNTPIPVVNNPAPEVCSSPCKEFVFTDKGGRAPVLVSVKSTITGPHGEFDADEGYDLYVYDPAGKLVADANGIGANGQAANFTPSSKAPGRYTIVVTADYAYAEHAKYHGEVRLMTGRSWRPVAATCGVRVAGHRGCYDLPRLRAFPPYQVTAFGLPPMASTPLGYPAPVPVPTPTSCYVDEAIGLDNTTITNATDPIERCLRFTTDIINIGAGPLEATLPLVATDKNGDGTVGYVPDQCRAQQIVTAADGHQVSRPAGGCEFHVEHGHFHYDGLLRYALYKVGKHGLPTGKVIESSKQSFCLTDDDYVGFGSARINGPRNYVGQPDCNVPRTVGAPTPGKAGTGTSLDEGMTPGWGDVYTWDTPGQFVDVTHVKAGIYDVVQETNPDGHVLVAGPAQTCSMTRLRLAVGSDHDTVKPLGSKASIRCPKGL
jgi:hypothetical protein